LPVAGNDSARIALAFYREGISLDNPFYSFLSLYKAFAQAIPTPSSRTPWLNANIRNLDEEDAVKRSAELSASGEDVGAYLYGKCRNAITHADREPFVDPDDVSDLNRLSRDLPLIRNFAELAIEETFSVKRERTIWREHLYELEGFRRLMPPTVLSALLAGTAAAVEVSFDLPDKFLVLAKRGSQIVPLHNMSVFAGWYGTGQVMLDLKSELDIVRLRIILSFATEKLIFEPQSDFVMRRADTLPGLTETLSALRFQQCILSNGHVEIWTKGGEERLGCAESYIPMNCMVNHEFFKTAERELQSKINELTKANDARVD
jgi:hypothetical protein